MKNRFVSLFFVLIFIAGSCYILSGIFCTTQKKATENIKFESATTVTDSLISVPQAGRLVVMSPTPSNGYGYRTVNLKNQTADTFFYNHPYSPLTASLGPDGIEMVGTVGSQTKDKIFRTARINLQTKSFSLMPQPWISTDQGKWSDDGKYVAFTVIDSTVSMVSQIGYWNIEKDSVILCKKSEMPLKSPRWIPGESDISCIIYTNAGSGILKYSLTKQKWDTLVQVSDKLGIGQYDLERSNDQMVFTGAYNNVPGLYIKNLKKPSTPSQIFKGICREPAYSPSGDTIVFIAEIEKVNKFVYKDLKSNGIKIIGLADTLCWPQWVYHKSN
jgi:Tol biopolymer transport system component